MHADVVEELVDLFWLCTHIRTQYPGSNAPRSDVY